jgi:hypothetical protein
LAKKVTFLLRTDPAVMEALKRWAGDELRSVNGQIEFILRRALLDAGRLKPPHSHTGEREHADDNERDAGERPLGRGKRKE